MKVNCRKIFGFRSKKKELLTLFLWDNASLNEINVFSLSELYHLPVIVKVIYWNMYFIFDFKSPKKVNEYF